ncbi:MAG: hypothetical protein H7831_14205 [Magnetococcus sp. WYHC-3]
MPKTKPCLNCGEPIVIKVVYGGGGFNVKFCQKPECQAALRERKLKQMRDWALKKRIETTSVNISIPINCANCQQPFVRQWHKQRYCPKPECQEAKIQAKKVLSHEHWLKVKNHVLMRSYKKLRVPPGADPPVFRKCKFEGCSKNAWPNRFYCKYHHRLVTKQGPDDVMGNATDNSLEELKGLTKALVKWRHDHAVPEEESRRHFFQTEKFAS